MYVREYCCEYCSSHDFEITPLQVRVWKETRQEKRPVPEGAKDLGLIDIWTDHHFEVVQQAEARCTQCGLKFAKLILCFDCNRPIVSGTGVWTKRTGESQSTPSDAIVHRDPCHLPPAVMGDRGKHSHTGNCSPQFYAPCQWESYIVEVQPWKASGCAIPVGISLFVLLSLWWGFIHLMP